MTPQLRQAIKLLQFSNLEVAAFVEGELERNPLLEWDERSDGTPEMPAPDQRAETLSSLDSADMVRMEKLPDAIEADHTNSFDQGGASDGFSRPIGPGGRDGSRDGGNDDRGIDDLAALPRNLRSHLGEQLRLSMRDPKDRIIGAQLIALLDGAGRVAATNAELAAAMGIEEVTVDQVRQIMMRFDPPGLFATGLRDCLAAQLADRNRLDPAMVALLDNLELLGRRDLRGLMQVCEVDGDDLTEMIAEIRALDPKPGAGWDDGPLLQVVPDVLMRGAAGRGMADRTQPRDDAARAGQRALSCTRQRQGWPGGTGATSARTFPARTGW